MTSFFKRLFGKVDKVSSIPNSTSTPNSEELNKKLEYIAPQTNVEGEFTKRDDTVASSIIVKASLSIVREEKEVTKAYNIGEINKQSTQIKNNEGLMSAISFITSFIESNPIDFDDLISLLKRLLTYMKNEKTLSDEYILDFINTQIEKHTENENIENYTRIADIIARVKISYAIEYLESKLNPTETDHTKNLTHFDSMILLSDYYLQTKQTDKAFQTIRRSSSLVTNWNEKYMFLTRQITIAEQSAKVCFEGQKTPLYADYLHYQTIVFILKQCINLLNFNSISHFYRDKEETQMIKTNHGNLENITICLDKLNIVKNREQLFNEINEYTFDILPINIGFPPEYLTPNFTFPNRNENYNEYRKIKDKQMEYDKIQFLELSSIYEFSSTVIKKYYNLENAK